jgi:hypothetical protein
MPLCSVSQTKMLLLVECVESSKADLVAVSSSIRMIACYFTSLTPLQNNRNKLLHCLLNWSKYVIKIEATHRKDQIVLTV